MIAVDGRLGAIGLEEVPCDRDRGEEIDGIAAEHLRPLRAAELRAELDPVLVVGRTGALTRTQHEAAGGRGIGEAGHGIVVTALTRLIW